MEYKDYYKILGLERKASKDEIKRSYRKLARKYHPDVSKEENAEDQFKEVQEAYEVLRDKEKRKAYDQLGSNWKAGQSGFQPPPDWQDNFDFGSGHSGHDSQYQSQGSSADYSSFFADLFGSATHTKGQGFNTKGENIRAKIMIDIEESVNGVTRAITLQSPEIDPQGRVISKQRTLKVKIPKGIKQGQTIRLAGEGNPGMGDAPAGDLLLEVAFNEHRLYTTHGKDIYLNVPVTPWEAALGAKIEVPTLTGRVNMKIPPNSQQGRKLRLKGKGLPGKNAGDFIVVLQLLIPPSTDPKAKALYEQMQSELDYNPRHF